MVIFLLHVEKSLLPISSGIRTENYLYGELTESGQWICVQDQCIVLSIKLDGTSLRCVNSNGSTEHRWFVSPDALEIVNVPDSGVRLARIF